MSLASRQMPITSGKRSAPLTLNEAERSVEVIASTEAPAVVWDWESFAPVNEVLLMSGCQLPETGRVPLLDTHSRDKAADIVGSFTDMRFEEGPHGHQLVGKCVFSATPDGEAPFRKVVEGHLTDVSIGYEVISAQDVKTGHTAVIEGKEYTGPMRVATAWRLFELSCVPIGADSHAKVRASALSNNQPAAVAAKQESRMKKREDVPATEEQVEVTETHVDESEARGLLARLRRLLGLREDVAEEPAADAAAASCEEEAREATVTDEAGTTVEPAELSDEELDQLVADVTEILDEAEAEQATREDDGETATEEERALCARVAAVPASQRAQLGQKVERARIKAIRKLATAFALSPREEANIIDSGMSLSRAKKHVEDIVNQRNSKGPGVSVSVGRSDAEKFRAAAQDSLLIRAGVSVENPAQGSGDLRSLSLRELAREMVSRSGGSLNGDIRAIVGRALATTDLPNLLVETSRRVLMEAYEAEPETWKAWCGTGSVSDFKTNKAVGLEGDVTLKEIPEYGEYQEGRMSENAEEFSVKTFGRKLVITRQSIINDDLSALSEAPRLYGEACARLVGDVAYNALLKAGKMGDGKALFHADHKNLFASKGGVPTVANLGDVVAGMKLQKDAFGNSISVLPKFFIAPVALESASEAFFNTAINGGPVQGTQAAPLVHNPYGGNYFTRVYDRRLDDVASDAWYLAAARATVNVYFLGGVEAPFIESDTNFDTDGFETKVRMDVGAKALRWVTVAKATA